MTNITIETALSFITSENIDAVEAGLVRRNTDGGGIYRRFRPAAIHSHGIPAGLQFTLAQRIQTVREHLECIEDGALRGTLVFTPILDSSSWQEPSDPVAVIRTEISRLEGELSRLSGNPILIKDGMNGGTVYADIPPGGALLDYETGIPEQQRQEWYPDLAAAKAGLLLLHREHHGELSESGLYLDADPILAYITRR